MTDQGKYSPEILAGLDEAVRLLDGDTREQVLPAQSTEALEFSKEVFTESLVAIVDPSSEWFSICALDTVVQAHKALTTTVNGRPNTEGPRSEAQLYTTLRMLHCVHYEKMSQDIRAKLPGIVLEYLAFCGLDEERGNQLCGPAGWERVKQSYASFRKKWNEANSPANSTETEDSEPVDTIATLREQIKDYQRQTKAWILLSICWGITMLVALYGYIN